MSVRNERTKTLANQTTSTVILLLSALVFAFYFSTNVLLSDVYQYRVVGALFELFSIPMLLLLVFLPVLCLVQLIKSKGAGIVYALVSLLLVAISIYILAHAVK